ncbi:MAG: restriction endonuclease [Burkholderiales bacterium]|jgi:restriction system protein|nr:restriction endonuclease [Burkholderiales bacterium]
MAIPTFEELFLPLLRLMEDEKEHPRYEVVRTLANQLQLNDAERKSLLPSGQQTVFDNRVGWARTGLIKAGMMESSRRGVMRITQRGKDILKENPPVIDIDFLKQRSPEFLEWRSPQSLKNSREPEPREPLPPVTKQTPEEALDAAYQELRSKLADDLLKRVHDCDPTFFEKLVIELLVKMGYGGSRQDAGTHLGKSGDGGIDGIINEDRLGLDVVYIQAKRWQSDVSVREIRDFVGALEGKGATKGIFITTSSYTKEARDYISRLTAKKVVLIDGEHLANLMIDFDIGVSIVSSYNIKRIDSDYFEED